MTLTAVLFGSQSETQAETMSSLAEGVSTMIKEVYTAHTYDFAASHAVRALTYTNRSLMDLYDSQLAAATETSGT